MVQWCLSYTSLNPNKLWLINTFGWQASWFFCKVIDIYYLRVLTMSSLILFMLFWISRCLWILWYFADSGFVWFETALPKASRALIVFYRHLLNHLIRAMNSFACSVSFCCNRILSFGFDIRWSADDVMDVTSVWRKHLCIGFGTKYTREDGLIILDVILLVRCVVECNPPLIACSIYRM